MIKLMERVMPQQSRQNNQWLAGMQSLGLLALTGALDYVTGRDVSFFLFYLAPILFALRRLGMIPALVMCVLSIGTWLSANAADGQVHVEYLPPLWGALLRFLIFLLVVSLFEVRGKLSEAVAREQRARLRLEKEVLEASERELRKIGHELHDSLCQHLTAAAIAGKVLANKLKAQARPEAEAANLLAEMIEHNIELTRKLTRSLHPLELRHEGLPDALRELAASVSSNGKAACAFSCSQNITLATVDANMHLYRIAQEAINLAVRHGRARNVKLHLKEQSGTITLSVTDDGYGPPADADNRGGMGLQMMRYRAGMIDAALQVESLPGGGCRMTCSLPDSRPANTQAHASQK